MNQQNAESKLEQAAEGIIKKYIPNGIVNVKGKGDGKPQYKAEVEIIKTCMLEFAKEYWQSLTTPASNEVEKGAWVSAKDSWPNERGSFITQNDSGGIGDYFIDDVNETSKKLWFNCAEAWLSKWWDKNASKPHTVEEGQTQEPVGGMKEMETFERMKKIQIWADEDSSKFQNACRDLGFDATDGAISGRSGGYTQAIKDIFSNPTKFGLTPPPAPVGIDVEAEKKIKMNLLWELIEDFQDARGNDDIHAPKFSFNDIEAEFYNKMEEIDTKAGYSASLPQSSTNNYEKVISETPQSIKDKVEKHFNEIESSTSERTVNDIIHCSCILLGIDDKECSVCYPSSTEEENLFVEWVGQTFVRMHGGWLYRYENQINPDLKTTNQLREKWEEIKRLSGRQ